jgi:hypothetical protein
MQLSLEMTLSQEEFLRLLPAAVGTYREEGDRFCGEAGGQSWVIRLVVLPERRLGSVRLPRHRVEICLKGYSREGIEAFLLRFHRGFQRGGG